MKHTSLPWRVGGNSERIIYAGDGFAVADATVFHGRHGGEDVATANAIFIVRACNAHDDLVTALRNLIEFCDTPAGFTKAVAMDNDQFASFIKSLDSKRDDVLKAARDALAKVESS